MKKHGPVGDVLAAGGDILFVKLSSLGDLFHALPLAHALKATGGRLTWVTQPSYRALAGCFQDVDRVLLFPRHEPWRAPEFLSQLRDRPYALACDAQGLLKSAWVIRAARAGIRIGPAHAREGAGWFYGLRPAASERKHAVEELLDLLEPLGRPRPARPCFPVLFPPAPVDAPPPRIALAPCSRHTVKNWPREHFLELGRALRDQCRASLFVVGGPQDRDTGAYLAAGLPGAMDWCGRTTLPELGGLLTDMDLMITVDSGPMHMAAAAGTRVLALFGPTDPGRTGPYGEGHRVLQAHTPCRRPCRRKNCPDCRRALAGITPAEVLAAARHMLPAH